MALHDQIMNLRITRGTPGIMASRDYKTGHRDARHDAAEMCLQAEAALAEAAGVIRELCAAYSHPLPEATLARLSKWGGA